MDELGVGVSHIRMRPGMYFRLNMHDFAYYAMSMSISEAMAGICNRISILLCSDNSIRIQDNGSGLAHYTPYHKTIEHIEHMMTWVGACHVPPPVLPYHTGGRWLSVINALSRWLRLEVRRDGIHYRQTYQHGIPDAPLQAVGTASSSGTVFHFLPDNTIFKDIHLHSLRLHEQLQWLPYLVPELMLEVNDRLYYQKGGLAQLVRDMGGVNPVHVQDEVNYIRVDVALARSDHFDIRGFCNTEVNTGGVHMQAVQDAAVGLNGLIAAVHVKHPDPHYKSHNEIELMNADVYQPVYDLVSRCLYEMPTCP
jgi:DNA gyrase subunit B